jgi:uncharacterized iron-regulated membrane protein
LKIVRKILFWCHLAVGLAVAAVVVLMSATGVLLTYQKQMQTWADTHALDGRAPSTSAPRLTADSVLASVARATGATPTAILVRSDANAPVEISLGRDRRVYVNAYTGAVLGEGSPRMRAFFRGVTSWHRTIGATGEHRALGRSLTGAANLGFFFIVVSGVFLWWPRTWTWTRLRNIALFRRGISGKARDFNWHNTIGVWSLIPLVAIVGSGVVMSYPWANALVYRVVGEQPPQQGARAARPVGRPPRGTRNGDGADHVGSPLGIEDALTIARARMPEWRSISIQLPSESAATLTAALDGGTGGQPQRRASLVLDRATGSVSRWEPFDSQTAGRRLRSILRFAHTGEVLGLPGQTIAGLVSLGAVVLAWTGIALALRRFVAWRRRRAREARATAPAPSADYAFAARRARSASHSTNGPSKSRRRVPSNDQTRVATSRRKARS